jgi:O-antigen biosynthesis protein
MGYPILPFASLLYPMKDNEFDVYRLWDELSATYPSFSFSHGWRLGVLATGSSIVPELVPFFKYNEHDSQDIRTCYEKTGRSMSDKFALRERQERELQLAEGVRNITAQLGAIKEQYKQQATILAATQARLETLKVENTHKDNHIATLPGEMQAQREENAKLLADIQKNAAVLENYSLQNTQLLKEIDGYRNSTSWKSTWPFRLISPAIKVVKLEISDITILNTKFFQDQHLLWNLI